MDGGVVAFDTTYLYTIIRGFMDHSHNTSQDLTFLEMLYNDGQGNVLWYFIPPPMVDQVVL